MLLFLLPPDVCPLLKIFQYVASRPNVSMSESQWCQFELEVMGASQCFSCGNAKMLTGAWTCCLPCLKVVKLLTRLFTQATATWIAFTRSSCQCDSEVRSVTLYPAFRQGPYVQACLLSFCVNATINYESQKSVLCKLRAACMFLLKPLIIFFAVLVS